MLRFVRKFTYWLHLWRTGVSVRPGTVIVAPLKLRLGQRCHFGSNCFLDARGGLDIGDGTIFANDVKVLSYNHNLNDRQTMPYDKRMEAKPVVIGRGCWLGQSVLVAPGAEMGEGSVAGIGSVVVGNVDANALVVGNPARQIRLLDSVRELYRNHGNSRRSSLLNIIRFVSLREL